jgi:hypothetical protein
MALDQLYAQQYPQEGPGPTPSGALAAAQDRPHFKTSIIIT